MRTTLPQWSAKACEQAGAALIAVHARTREQMYTPASIRRSLPG